MQLAINLGMNSRFVLHTPLMWLDKAATFAMADTLGILDVTLESTHTCYRGDRIHRHPWGYGCNDCPACHLRAEGWARYQARA
jgi:7-cyano-7-deazaguanine synthase